MSHHYETADFGEPLDVNSTIRVIAFRHGDRLKYRFEALRPPIVVSRPKLLDKGAPGREDTGDSTT